MAGNPLKGIAGYWLIIEEIALAPPRPVFATESETPVVAVVLDPE